MDEQKNPYYIAGKARLTALDYKGAIQAFEKALEIHPQSALAHFELGLLHEQHDDQDNHFILAMYHYKRAMDLRPGSYPYDNAKMRMAWCKQELAKAESIAPYYHTLQREFDRLKEENATLRAQLASWQTSASRQQMGSSLVATQSFRSMSATPSPAVRTPEASRSAAVLPSSRGNSTPPPSVASRSHTVKPGENPSSIARQYGLSLDALMAANPSVNPRKLRAGQTLQIPSR